MKLFSQIDEFIKKQHLNQMPWQINSYLYARKTPSGHFPLLAVYLFRLHKSAASIFDRKPIDIFDVVTRVWENVIPIKMTQKYTEAIKWR